MFYIMLWKTIAFTYKSIFVSLCKCLFKWYWVVFFVIISFSWRGEYFLWAWRWYRVTSHSLGTKHSNIESIWVVYIHSSNNLFCSFLDGIDTQSNNSFIQWLYIETIRDSEPFQYLMLGKSYDFRNCYSFEYSFDVCIQYASLTLSNGMKIFFWFHLQI